MSTPGSTRPGSPRELAHRVGGGMEVALFWDPVDGSTTIGLWDTATGLTFRFEVPRERALEAFYHPLLHLQPGAAA